MNGLRKIALTYLASFRSEWGFMTTLTQTKPFCCRALMLFMNLAVPRDFSYVRSESSGTSIPAEPADRVVTEKPCPIMMVVMLLLPSPRWLQILGRCTHRASTESKCCRLPTAATPSFLTSTSLDDLFSNRRRVEHPKVSCCC